MPKPELAGSTGGTGIGAGGAGAGAGTTSTCGNTHPAAGCTAAAAAAAAAPHTAAVDAPPLMRLRTAHGSGCVAGGAAAAIAAVELKTIEPAINAPIAARYRLPPMSSLL